MDFLLLQRLERIEQRLAETEKRLQEQEVKLSAASSGELSMTSGKVTLTIPPSTLNRAFVTSTTQSTTDDEMPEPMLLPNGRESDASRIDESKPNALFHEIAATELPMVICKVACSANETAQIKAMWGHTQILLSRFGGSMPLSAIAASVMDTADRVARYVDAYRQIHWPNMACVEATAIPIMIDTAGVFVGVIDMVRDAGFNVVSSSYSKVK